MSAQSEAASALERPAPQAGAVDDDDDAEAAEVARLTAEAAELIATLKALYTESGCRSLDEHLARARHLAKIKAAAEGVEVTAQALRTAEIDVCRHTLEMIRASQAQTEALKARYRAEQLRQAEAERELDRGVPMTMPGVDPSPRYRWW